MGEDQAVPDGTDEGGAPPDPGNAAGREFDIVVFGATGFVGQLIAEYLAEHAPAGTRIALAGRSQSKLEALRDGIPAASDWPLIVADSADVPSVQVAVREAKQVLTGSGTASKQQLEETVRHRLKHKTSIRPFHASDALALAIIGLYRYKKMAGS